MPASAKSVLLLPEDAYALTEADKKRAAEERALGLIAPYDPVLRKKATAVPLKRIGSAAVRKVIDRLFNAAHGQRRTSRSTKKRRTLVGLAAPQIGESMRIILIDTRVAPDRKHYGSLECLINPEIIWRSRETDEGREGCFSAGPVWGLVRRSVAVKIRALTPAGEIVERILEGFTARIAQHEIDHLDGLRFPDRIRSDRKRHWVHTEELDTYPKHVKYWPRHCSLERWKRFITNS